MRKIRYWFISDCHFNHENIIKYCDRPFDNVYDMNETIIANWNSRVKPGDLVYHNGDFCFKNSAGGRVGEGLPIKAHEMEARLNGKIIHIKGNHDRNNSVKSIVEKIIIKYGPHYIAILHNPENYDMNFKINFVGHVHNKWKFRRVFNPMYTDRYTDLINIGVDVWDFKPVTFEEIYRDYKRWSKKAIKKWKDKD